MEAFQKLGKITRPRPLREARAAQQNARTYTRKETTSQKNRRRDHRKVGSEESKENEPIAMAPLFSYNRPNAAVNKGFKNPGPSKKRSLERDSTTVDQRRPLEESKERVQCLFYDFNFNTEMIEIDKNPVKAQCGNSRTKATFLG